MNVSRGFIDAVSLKDQKLETLRNLIDVTDFNLIGSPGEHVNYDVSMFDVHNLMYRPTEDIDDLKIGPKLRAAIEKGDFVREERHVFESNNGSGVDHRVDYFYLPHCDTQFRKLHYGFELPGIEGFFLFYDPARDIKPLDRFPDHN